MEYCLFCKELNYPAEFQFIPVKKFKIDGNNYLNKRNQHKNQVKASWLLSLKNIFKKYFG
jgi:hypothetical protein